ADHARSLIGIFHLAEDLRLAQHHRIEPGRDAKQMAYRGLILVQIEELREPAAGRSLRTETMMFEEPALRNALRARVHVDVQLGAVAGRENEGLVDAGLAREVVQGLWRRFGRERDLLAQIDR